MDRKRRLRPIAVTATLISLVLLSLLVHVFNPRMQAHAGSFKSPSSLPTHPTINRDGIISRAKTWVEAHVPYDDSGSYQGYREDCSGYVSMAWQLSASLTTYTLPSVSHQINKDDLQPGDILLNQWGGWIKYGSPDAHVVIFDSWVNSSHTLYNAYEESPYYGEAHYTTNIPYPYWAGYDSSDYVPMRLNGLSNSPASKPTPTPSETIDAALHSKTNPYPPYTGQLVLDDPLDHPDGEWPSSDGPCVFQNGKYILTAMEHAGGSAICPGNQQIIGDFTFQVETTFVYQSYAHPSPNDDGAAGIDFSPNDISGRDYFRCFINQQGVLSLAFIRPGDNGFHSVTRQIPSFKKDQPNLLAVVVVGEQVAVYLNVVKELTATIPNLGQGHLTLEVDFGEYGYYPSAAFQNAKLWA